MKKWIYYAAMAFACAGCDMTLLPETQITDEDVVKELVDVEKCLMSAYIMDGAISAKIDCDRGLADEIIPAYESLDPMLYFYDMNASEMYRSEEVQSLYAGFYSSIAICNQTLDQLKRCPVSDTARWKQLKGEALALRAFDHFSLVNYFARPYWDSPETNLGVILKNEFSLEEAPRATVKEVYDTVVSNLNQARQLMTLTENAPSRFTADGATALLCRVYLFMENWKMVIEEANKLIGKYNFPKNPEDQFDEIDGEGEIFTLDFSYNDFGFYYAQGTVADQFKDVFQYDDYRFNTYLEEYDDYIITPEGYIEWISITTFSKVGLTYKTLRIAEVYLNRAEAYYRLGEEDLARQDLIEVASHSGADIDYMNTLEGEDLMEEIMNEREREFAGEGYRALDLLRWKLPVVRYYDEDNSLTLDPVQTIAINDFCRILPIPHQECYLNRLVEQNPGYPRDTRL